MSEFTSAVTMSNSTPLKAPESMTKNELHEELRRLQVTGFNNKTKKEVLVHLLAEARKKLEDEESAMETDSAVPEKLVDQVETPKDEETPESSQASDTAEMDSLTVAAPETPVAAEIVPEVVKAVEMQMEEAVTPKPAVVEAPVEVPASVLETPTLADEAVKVRSPSTGTLAEATLSEKEEIQHWLEVQGFANLKKTFETEELQSWDVVRELRFEHLRALGMTLGVCIRLLRCVKERFEESAASSPFQFDEMRSALNTVDLGTTKKKSNIAKPATRVPTLAKPVTTPVKAPAAKPRFELEQSTIPPPSAVKPASAKPRQSLVPSMLMRAASAASVRAVEEPKEKPTISTVKGVAGIKPKATTTRAKATGTKASATKTAAVKTAVQKATVVPAEAPAVAAA
ncbi:hypothetical protein HDU96_002920 [Phlyctochytrium bullatum]|nr:hypothetical protein HDU96_002920 [Phlyctochytrium bullatum]